MKKNYLEMTKEELLCEKELLDKLYEAKRALGLKLDMSRGKPNSNQLDISNDLLNVLDGNNYSTDAGFDARNYGILAGIPEARKLIADLCGVESDNVIMGGTASLEVMYNAVVRAMLFGTEDGKTPWIKQGKIKFLCPAPGYDRHFGMCADLGIELITVKMTDEGPDMDEVERLVSSDPSIKGIWCVPKYSNPDGITYSDETVRRIANLSCAADDFRVFWDNAYFIHDVTDTPDSLLNIFDIIRGTKNEDLVYMFVSTSKITFPGGGISAFISSKKNVDHALSHIGFQTISYDKLNQLRHVKLFKNADGVLDHMQKHKELLKPKFAIVAEKLESELAGRGIAKWKNPNGGYFVSLYTTNGTARRVGELCRNAGVTLTSVGATYPYGVDPDDSNIRIAPSYPSQDELSAAMDVLCVCVRLAALEALLKQ